MKGWKQQLREIKDAIADSFGRKARDEKSRKGDSNAQLPQHQDVPATQARPITTSVVGATSGRRAGMPTEESLAPIFRPHVARGRVLAMPSWGDTGSSLQYPGRRDGNLPTMVVRIGVDFGTAFTKVAIRAGADLVPIDWSPVSGDESAVGRFILPGMVGRTTDGLYCWDPSATTDFVGNLKLPIIDKVDSVECPTDSVAYLALVIRYARAFIYRHKELASKLASRTLRWELNIGCPTEPHENPEVVRMFVRIAKVSWNLAADTDLRTSRICAMWNVTDRSIGLEADPGVIPEFVAQIAGYLKSPQATGGMHALIDVGAATLDVATFNVSLSADRAALTRIPIFFSAVRPLGTHYLQHRRCSSLGLDLTWDDSAPVVAARDFASTHGKSLAEVEQSDSEFAEEIVKCIVNVIESTRTTRRGSGEILDRLGRYGRGSVWRNGLPIFITGGGAVSEFYIRIIESAQGKLKKRIGGTGSFRFIEMDPLGGSCPNLSGEVVRRLTVAIGLTEDSESIARIVPHRDIEPIKRSKRERRDHSELYGD